MVSSTEEITVEETVEKDAVVEEVMAEADTEGESAE